tara:strand:+ start:8109 stop:8612 length:504 start_codon:yes stop_codon:yes gene_type:complete
MSGQITETTAMQRLGHVFGWTGYAIGGLAILAAIVAICINAWSYFFPVADGSGFDVELADGRKYIAIGAGSAYDAERAIREYAGEEITARPYGSWKVFPEAAERGAQAEEVELEKEKVRAIKRARIRTDSFDSMTLATLLGIVPGILIFLLGLALRYIFAGPIKRPR